MRFFRLAAAFLALLLVLPVSAQTIPLGDKSACMEGPLAEFGQYIGNWNISDLQLSQDGKTWSPGAGAKWNFVCVGDGTAIQDFWMPNDGPVGTNLRTYNTESETWDIAWTIKGMPPPGFSHITAKKADDGSMVMHFVAPIPNPLRRITFFPADSDGWDWTMEMSTDGGENWFAVYKIRADRST